jgi:hypothetical protein
MTEDLIWCIEGLINLSILMSSVSVCHIFSITGVIKVRIQIQEYRNVYIEVVQVDAGLVGSRVLVVMNSKDILNLPFAQIWRQNGQTVK